MTIESLLIPLLSAAIGWTLRHYGVIAPAPQAPQTRPAAGGTVSPVPAQGDIREFLRMVVQEEMQKGLAYLTGKLAPQSPATASPQT